MEIKTNPPGSKYEATLYTDWIDAPAPGQDAKINYFEYFKDLRAQGVISLATEEMLKGQAFGL
jgi:hypothetical protein